MFFSFLKFFFFIQDDSLERNKRVVHSSKCFYYYKVQLLYYVHRLQVLFLGVILPAFVFKTVNVQFATID